MNILVHECMAHETESLRSEDTLGDALHVMRMKKIRHLPVVDGNEILGMISERDVLAWLSPRLGTNRELPFEFEALHFPVADVMKQPVFAIAPDRPIQEALTLLLEENIGALPVIDAQARLCGILSAVDLLRRFRDLLAERVRE
jgi:acetoin utilization protein AcuB